MPSDPRDDPHNGGDGPQPSCVGRVRRDECFEHPGNVGNDCASCAAYRVGLRGHAALDAAEAGSMIRLRDQWVRTTRPATPGRTGWVDLWTAAGAAFRAWWGRDTDGTLVREIEGQGGFAAEVHADPRCDAIELARIWFPDPADVAPVLNGLPDAATAEMAGRLWEHFPDADPPWRTRLARSAVILGLTWSEVRVWASSLDELEYCLSRWAPWRDIKALPDAAAYGYPTLIDRLAPLDPHTARPWVAVVGVDHAVEWWRLGAQPAEAERALSHTAARIDEPATLVDAAVGASLGEIDPALAGWIGRELRRDALQRAAIVQARSAAGLIGRCRWRFRALARRRRSSASN